MVYIHCGQKERAPIAEEELEAYTVEADKLIMEEVWSDKWDPYKNIRFPWNKWVKGMGIIGCLNPDSVEYMVKLASEIKVLGKTFKAWRKGEYGFSTLVTLVLPPGAEKIKKENLVPLILKQNGLAGTGKHTVPKFKTKVSRDKAKAPLNMVTMGVAPELAMAFRALGGFASMGARTVKITVSKEEDDDAEAAPKVVEPEITSVKPPATTVTEVEVTEVEVTDPVKPVEASEVEKPKTDENEEEK